MNKLKRLQQGFTLTELLIVVAIIGILTAIALPNYRQYVIKSNRVAAQSEMMDIANREQQFLLADRAYVNKAALVASGYVPTSQVASKYTYNVTADNTATPPTFTITFTPTDSTLSGEELTLNSAGVKTPAGKW